MIVLAGYMDSPVSDQLKRYELRAGVDIAIISASGAKWTSAFRKCNTSRNRKEWLSSRGNYLLAKGM